MLFFGNVSYSQSPMLHEPHSTEVEYSDISVLIHYVPKEHENLKVLN